MRPTIWLGLMAPADTPRPIIDKINAAVECRGEAADIVKVWNQRVRFPMSMTPDEFDDVVKWAEVVKKFDKPPQ